MARRRKTDESLTEPGEPLTATGQARYLSPYATRQPAEVRALQRMLNIEYPTAGVNVRPQRRDYVQLNAGGTGWGSAVYMRPRYRGRGANRELHSVWTLPVGILAVILVGYFVERIMVGMSAWWPGSKVTLALDDFGSWFSKNVLPSGTSIGWAGATVTSWGTNLSASIQQDLQVLTGGLAAIGTTTPGGGSGSGGSSGGGGLGGGGGSSGGGGTGPGQTGGGNQPTYLQWNYSPPPTGGPFWKWHSGMVGNVYPPTGQVMPPGAPTGPGWGPGVWEFSLGGPGSWIPPTF